MNQNRSPSELRAILLETISGMAASARNDAFSVPVVFELAEERAIKAGKMAPKRAFLDQWHELVRTGLVAPGTDFASHSHPWYHLTERGQRTITNLSRDPANPLGYMEFLRTQAALNPTAQSYVAEALDCFAGGLSRAAAVMIGCASESLALELRDAMMARFGALGRQSPKGLDDWRIKVVLDSMADVLGNRQTGVSRDLRPAFEAYWLAFVQQIRMTRNEAGHPTSVAPIEEESAHAALLIFPHLAKLSRQLCAWVAAEMR